MTPPNRPCVHPEWIVHAQVARPGGEQHPQYQATINIACTVCATKLLFTAVNPATLNGTELAVLALAEDNIWLRHSGITYSV